MAGSVSQAARSVSQVARSVDNSIGRKGGYRFGFDEFRQQGW
jgi:hypothetical protein